MATIELRRPVNPRIEPYSAPASTAYAAKTLVIPNETATANTFTAATAASASILGVLQKKIASTDADYTSEKLVSVLVDEDGDWEFTVGTGTADVNDEQGFIDLKDADEVDVTASSVDVVFATRFVSGTKVRGKITLWAWRQPPQIRA